MNLVKELNINQMFDEIQMIMMMKTSTSNNCISQLNRLILLASFKNFELNLFEL